MVHNIEIEIEQSAKLFQLKEDEHTWESFDTKLNGLAAFIGCMDPKQLTCTAELFKDLVVPINGFILSERTRLSGSAVKFVCCLSSVLREPHNVFLDNFVGTLIKLSGRPNKVSSTRASSCLLEIVKTHVPVRYLYRFVSMLESPNKNVRISGSCLLHQLLKDSNRESLCEYIELINTGLRCGINNATPEVREISTKSFELYNQMFSDRAREFLSMSSPHIQKILKMKVANVPNTKELSVKTKNTIADVKERLKNNVKNEGVVFISTPKGSLDDTKKVVPKPPLRTLQTPKSYSQSSIRRSPQRLSKSVISKDVSVKQPLTYSLGNALRIPKPLPVKLQKPINSKNLGKDLGTPIRLGPDSVENSTSRISERSRKTLIPERQESRNEPSSPIFSHNKENTFNRNIVMSKLTDIKDLKRMLCDENLVVRMGAIKRLQASIAETTSKESLLSRVFIQGIVECVLISLSDSHPKVVAESVNIVLEYLDVLFCTNTLDICAKLVSKILGIQSSPMFRGRSAILGVCRQLIDKIETNNKKDEFIQVLSTSLGTQEVLADKRLKSGLLKMIRDRIGNANIPEYVYKSILPKIHIILEETEQVDKNIIGSILHKLWDADNNTFLGFVTEHVPYSCTQYIKNTISRHDRDYARKEETYIKMKHKRNEKLKTSVPEDIDTGPVQGDQNINLDCDHTEQTSNSYTKDVLIKTEEINHSLENKTIAIPYIPQDECFIDKLNITLNSLGI